MTIPTLVPWQRWLLGSLFGLYVAELVLANAWSGLYPTLAWHPFRVGFAPWQLLTRFAVQGPDVMSVVFALVVLFFFLPSIDQFADRPTTGKALLAGVVGGTALPLLADAIGLGGFGPAYGWVPLVMVLPLLLGLYRPDAQILLFVFPIKAGWLVWGELVLALLFLLVDRTLGTFQGLGIWLGVYGWYQLLGPGRRRRDLQGKARTIERELRRFEVLDGGKSGRDADGPGLGPKRSGGFRAGNRPDDTVH